MNVALRIFLETWKRLLNLPIPKFFETPQWSFFRVDEENVTILHPFLKQSAQFVQYLISKERAWQLFKWTKVFQFPSTQKNIDFIKVYAFQHLYEFWKLGHKGSLGKQIIDKERWQEETNSNKGSKRFLSCSSSSSYCTWFWKLLRVSKSSAASFQSKTCIFSLMRWGLEDLGIALTPRCIAHLMSTWPGVFLIFSAICMSTKSHDQSITFVKSLVLRWNPHSKNPSLCTWSLDYCTRAPTESVMKIYFQTWVTVGSCNSSVACDPKGEYACSCTSLQSIFRTLSHITSSQENFSSWKY